MLSPGFAAVFRCDASPTLGGGHVMRCLALADVLTEAGGRCTFAVRAGTAETVPMLAEHAVELIPLDCEPDGEAAMLSRLLPGGADILVVDHYRRGLEFERACRPIFRRIMVIEDVNERTHDCDLLLDQTLGRSARDYAELVPPSCRLLLGASYALLRREFPRARAAALDRRGSRGPGSLCILVNFGATDPSDATSTALEGIALAAVPTRVTVVLCSASPNIERVRRVAGALPFPTALCTDSRDVADLMSRADLAVGAAGFASWERCCMGLPALVIETADNQRRIAAALAAAGAVWLLGEAASVTPDDVAGALRRLADEDGLLREMSLRARAVCDGQGAFRVHEALAA